MGKEKKKKRKRERKRGRDRGREKGEMDACGTYHNIVTKCEK